jgi:hypothetical protein
MNQPPPPERLYHLLPAIYRLRDEVQGGQLRALLATIEEELLLIQDDIENLYDNWFIETCDDWVVPYIGELLAVQELNGESSSTYGGQERRAYIANTLAYRQRKGTTAVLEQLARDITGWYARAVEPGKLLATTQTLHHIRPNTVTADIRRTQQPERLGTPFEQRVAYTTELRTRPQGRGRYNLTTIALYVWRLQSYFLERGTARLVNRPDANSQGRFYTFNPCDDGRPAPAGRPFPLFNRPQTETEITGLAAEINVPGPLCRSTLEAELEARQQQKQKDTIAGGQTQLNGYFGEDPVFQVFTRSQTGWERLLPEQMIIGDLSKWILPSDLSPQTQVVVDPEWGRLAFPTSPAGRQVEVSYAYGFSGDVGGGPYNRVNAIADQIRSRRMDPSTQIWDISAAAHPSQAIADALNQWNQLAAAAQNCYDQTYIPVARLAVNGQGEVRSLAAQDDPKGTAIRPQFTPGVVKELTVHAAIGGWQAVVLPGVAIDQEGNLIRLRMRYRVNLGCYRNQAILIVISYQNERWQPRWRIQAIPVATASQFPETQYIRLLRCVMDGKGRIAQIDASVRQPFTPGIIRGLQLGLPSTLKGTISPGLAINRQGKLITVVETDAAPCTYDLTTYQNPDRPLVAIVLLYLAPCPAPDPPQVGTVREVQTGIVYLQDNRTYLGDWLLQIPAGKRVWIVAANGRRPCLRGNLGVQTLALADDDFSECLLEGVLLKGILTVAPGRLQRLKLAHCTLVPQAGGLEVTKEDPTIAPLLDDPFSLLTLVFYALAVIQRLISLGFSTTGTAPQQRLTRLFRFARQQTTTLFQWVQQTWQACLQLPSSPLAADSSESSHACFSPTPAPGTTGTAPQQNAQLSVEIERSICGSIALADTVPMLHIRESIIDAAPQADQVNEGAIVATGTAVELEAVTVLGTTTVRSLEASDSIFTDKIWALRRQVGCLRFCAIPEESRTPRRYRCQPDLKLAEAKQTPASPITALTRQPTTQQARTQQVRTQQVFAATLGTGVFRFIEHSHPQHWVPINEGLTNLSVTALLALEQTLVAGTTGGEMFLASLLRPGLGTLTSEGTTVNGQGTFFQQQLSVGDSLIVDNQTRSITEIVSDTKLKIDQAFNPELSDGSAFQTKHIRWTAVTPAPCNTAITTIVSVPAAPPTVLARTAGRGISVPAAPPTVLAGTAGRGILQSIDAGKTWTVIDQKQGLTNLDVRAIAHHPTQGLYAATQGGVFHSTDGGETWQETIAPTQPSRTPQPRPINLTALTLNPDSGHLFVGTATDGIFRSSDGGQHWTPVNRHLTTLNITALVSYLRSGTGTLSSRDTQVKGDQTQFSTQLAVKDALVAGGQTRLVTAIAKSAEKLTINQPFDPDLPAGTPFTVFTLLAGTAGGTVFRSTDAGETWTKISTGLTHTDVTGLLAWINPTPLTAFATDQAYRTSFTEPGATNVLAGTQVGSIYRTVEGSDLPNDRQNQRWISINTGLNQVDETLLLLNQMQPRFTSTTYGDPGYAQLTTATPLEIRTGAEDGSEMGVFHFLKQPQQEANLKASLKEYLRFGLEADLIDVT